MIWLKAITVVVQLKQHLQRLILPQNRARRGFPKFLVKLFSKSLRGLGQRPKVLPYPTLVKLFSKSLQGAGQSPAVLTFYLLTFLLTYQFANVLVHEIYALADCHCAVHYFLVSLVAESVYFACMFVHGHL